jgi:hypothetical protein
MSAQIRPLISTFPILGQLAPTLLPLAYAKMRNETQTHTFQS